MSTLAKNRYNSANYTRLSVFADKNTANRIKEAAEAAGESINAFIITSALARIDGGASPRIKIDASAPAERLLVEHLEAVQKYNNAQEKSKTAYAELRKTTERMAELIKVGLE